MTYPESLAFLGKSRFFGMKPGLDRMRRIAKRLGSPQQDLRFIHIAGTNGKGSTAAFAESCLRSLSLRVGLYTSPHLISVRERFQINRVPISEAAFAEGLAQVRDALDQVEDGEATFFELTTALALVHFAREKVDWVVWETGLGGRLDATNIVDPEICIITSIGLDHQRYLGETLPEIASEKAGIIKPGVPVVFAPQAAEVIALLQKTAHEKKAPFLKAESVEDSRISNGLQHATILGHNWALGLIGAHQSENASCALTAIRHLLSQADDAFIAQGLKDTHWPARFQVVGQNPLMVIDGAHNPDGIKRLIQTWRQFLSFDAKVHLIFASVADKNSAEMADLLRPLAKCVSLVRLANERTADPAQLASYFHGLPCRCYASVSELNASLKSEPSDDPVLITGSLFLAGEILAAREGLTSKYEMNERLESPALPVRL